MSEQLAIDILKLVLPAVVGVIVWQQKQISDNARYIRHLLDKCLSEDEQAEIKQNPRRK